jgi:RNA polymerase sigma-70 factor (ECF subfamily)
VQERQIQDDFELFRQIKAGDRKAFSVIYEKYREVVYTTAYLVLRDKTDAEDVMQEVFLALWAQRNKIEIKSTVKFYLSRIAHNMSLNKIEHNSNHAKRNLRYTKMNVNFEHPYVYVNNNEQRDTLNNAMKTLPEKSRRSLELVYFEEKSHKEVADLIGLSVNTVKTQVYSSLKLMRAKLHLK